MSDKKCCVPGCLVVSRGLHKFPHPEKDDERFHVWVNSIGGDILSLTDDFIFKYRRVCNAHFEEKYWCRYNRISSIAVPTLYIDAPKQVTKIAEPVKSSHQQEIPTFTTINEVIHMEAVSPNCIATVNKQCPCEEPELIKREIGSDDLKMEPVVIPGKVTKKQSITEVISLRKKLNKYRRKIKHLTEVLKKAKRDLKLLSNLPSDPKVFTMMQCRKCKKKCKGR